ncbi:hypothetical protein [Sulfitobacter aestuariivivens]|uniref:Lipoprotein n=1 Tax=Sulfitobacter aestuariivivens TaxID=2766981 RepID=A0A927HFK5_9RHOB|nr:hypothetical protein [Sulfitobacter aestuariivivens]MBD3663340.1 hypothetical protein [Sulfitobacter aestuariivivens]
MLKYLMIPLCAGLVACGDLPQTSDRAPREIGQTETGKPVYQFRLTRSNALGITPVSSGAIAARALEICPTGYREIGRTGEVTRRISGVIYTDVDVTIICA